MPCNSSLGYIYVKYDIYISNIKAYIHTHVNEFSMFFLSNQVINISGVEAIPLTSLTFRFPICKMGTLFIFS